MLIAGLNYNSNLGLAFAFFMVKRGAGRHASLPSKSARALSVDAATSKPTLSPGADAAFSISSLETNRTVDRCDIEIRLPSPNASAEPGRSHQKRRYRHVMNEVLADHRGRVEQRGLVPPGTQFELRNGLSLRLVSRLDVCSRRRSPSYVAPRAARRAAAAVAASTEREKERQCARKRAATRTSPACARMRPVMPLKHMAWKVLARGGDAGRAQHTPDPGRAQPEWLEWSSLEGTWTAEARLSQLCRWILECESAYQRPYMVCGCRASTFGPATRGRPSHRNACGPWPLTPRPRRDEARAVPHRPRSVSYPRAGNGIVRLPGARIGRTRHIAADLGCSPNGVRDRRDPLEPGGARLRRTAAKRHRHPCCALVDLAVSRSRMLFLQLRTFNGL